jgi:hypothetical protein
VHHVIDHGTDAGEDGAAVEVPHIAGSAVAEVDGVGEATEHRHGSARSDRQHRGAVDRLVAEQDDGAGGDLACELSVLRRSEDGSRRGRRGQDVVEPQQRGHDPPDGAVDVGPRRLAVREGPREVLGPHHAVGHLDVEPCGQRRRRVTQTEDPIADDEALEPPLVSQDVGEQLTVLAAPLAVDAVVGRHHRGDALVDDPMELPEVHLVEGDVVDLDVDGEAGVLHRVAREVLHARHDVALQAPREGGSELADVVGVLAVRLLGPAPRRMTKHVDAHGASEVGPDRPQLTTDGVADPFLEVRVPGRAAGHRHREAGGVAHHGATGSVAEPDARQADSLDLGGDERRQVVPIP